MSTLLDYIGIMKCTSISVSACMIQHIVFVNFVLYSFIKVVLIIKIIKFITFIVL